MNEQTTTLIFGFLIVSILVYILVNLPGILLFNKFKKIKDNHDLNRQDIIKKLGKHKVIVYLEDGLRCTWKEKGYEIVLLFDKTERYIKLESESTL